MKYKYLLFLLPFFGCKRTNIASTYLKKDVEFNIGFNATSKFSGSIENKKDNKTYIYYADPVTKKSIGIFTEEGILIKTINIKNLLKSLNFSISGICIKSLDTIIGVEDYTGNISIINQKGDCWKNIKSKQFIDSDNPDFYFYNPPINTGAFYKNDMLLLSCDWRENKTDIVNGIVPEDNNEYGKYYYSTIYRKPFFLKIERLFDGKIKSNYILNDYFSEISTVPKIFACPAIYKIIGNDIYNINVYSNIIVRYNVNDIKNLKKIKVSSDYTSIGLPLLEIKKENFSNLQDNININAKTKGAISSIYYDSIKKIYYIIVYHNYEISKYPFPTNCYLRPFSIIVYDKTWKKKDEIPFTDLKYNPECIIQTKKGLLLKQNDSIQNEKIRYTLFSY